MEDKILTSHLGRKTTLRLYLRSEFISFQNNTVGEVSVPIDAIILTSHTSVLDNRLKFIKYICNNYIYVETIHGNIHQYAYSYNLNNIDKHIWINHC